jgi:hypothetical protein
MFVLPGVDLMQELKYVRYHRYKSRWLMLQHWQYFIDKKERTAILAKLVMSPQNLEIKSLSCRYEGSLTMRGLRSLHHGID